MTHISEALRAWETEMAHHEKMEAEFFERVRTGRQAAYEPEWTHKHWMSLAEVRVCDDHGERPASERECPQCAGSRATCAADGCNNPVVSKRSDAKCCSNACRQRACRKRVSVTDNEPAPMAA